MELLNKAQSQLLQLWRALTPGARIIAGLLSLVVVIGVAVLFRVRANSLETELLGGQAFSASELPHVVAALGKAGLTYTVVGDRIRIPRSQEADYVSALAESDALPQGFGNYLEKAANDGSLVDCFNTSRKEQIIKNALHKEIQIQLRKMPGIEDAYVLSSPQAESEGFSRREVIKAAVGLKGNGKQPVDEELIPAVRSLVANAIGCKGEDVTVVDLNSGVSYGGDDVQGSVAGLDQTRASAQRRHEQALKRKVESHLESYLQGAVVTPTVTLDPATLRPTRATVAVGIPKTNYERIWCQRQASSGHTSGVVQPDLAALAAIEAETKQDVERAVATLLPPVATSDLHSPVQVSTIELVNSPIGPTTASADSAMQWLLHNWRLAMTVVVAFAGWLAWRWLLRSVPVPLPMTSQVVGASQPAMAPEVARRAPHRPAWTSPAMRDELSDVVRDDPEAAVGILRTWIGKARPAR